MATLGQTLRAAREKLQQTPSQVAEATRMKVQTITDLERDDFRKIAAPIYARGFIRMYAEYLALDPQPLLDLYVAQVGGVRRVEATAPATPAAGARVLEPVPVPAAVPVAEVPLSPAVEPPREPAHPPAAPAARAATPAPANPDDLLAGLMAPQPKPVAVPTAPTAAAEPVPQERRAPVTSIYARPASRVAVPAETAKPATSPRVSAARPAPARVRSSAAEFSRRLESLVGGIDTGLRQIRWVAVQGFFARVTVWVRGWGAYAAGAVVLVVLLALLVVGVRSVVSRPGKATPPRPAPTLPATPAPVQASGPMRLAIEPPPAWFESKP